MSSLQINTYLKEDVMSRPKPTILCRNIDPDTHKVSEVLASEAIYAVYYQNKPINLRTLHNLISDPGPKYKKVSFSNPGHAFNLAEKLNEMFQTNDFQVYELINGKSVTENKS